MERNSDLVTVDAAAVLDQVSSRLRQEALLPEHNAVRIHSGRVHHGNNFPVSGLPASGDYLAQIALRLQSLQSGLDSRVESAVRNIGAAPPRASSLRGRIGGAAIGILRGLLWWQTRSLHGFGDALAEHHQAELELLKCIVLAQAEMRQEVDELRAAVDRMRAGT